MSTVYTTSLTTAHHLSSPLTPGVKLVHHLNGYTQPMDGRQPKYEAEYPQSGLNSSYPTFPEPDSEGSSADQASAAQYTPGQDPRTSNFSSSATPTSEYGLAPSSARSGSFPDYIQRGYHPSSGQTTPAGGMAQATSPSSPLHNGAANNSGHSSGSNSDLPLDPSIAAASPTYTPHQPPYSPYGPPSHENPQHYQQHSNIYARPDWAISQPYPPAHPHMPHYGHATSGAPAPAMVSPVARPPTVGTLARITMYSAPQSDANYSQGGHPMSTVYSFVPIPGAQQHKRPRRRYEEIERMYKCGWNGCEKAYGTLNHLNAHVTMQSHGTKRTPEGKLVSVYSICESP